MTSHASPADAPDLKNNDAIKYLIVYGKRFSIYNLIIISTINELSTTFCVLKDISVSFPPVNIFKYKCKKVKYNIWTINIINV